MYIDLYIRNKLFVTIVSENITLCNCCEHNTI